MSLINLGVRENLLDGVAAAPITGNMFATPTRASQFTYQTLFDSNPSAINITIQTSLDGASWITISTTTNTSGATVTFQSAAPFIRAKINSITGGSGVTVAIIAKTGVIGTANFVSGPSGVEAGSLAIYDGASGQLLDELPFPGDDTLFLAGDGTFKSVGGGNPFDQNLNTTNDVQFKSVKAGTGPFSSTGAVRLANDGVIAARNADNSGDIDLILPSSIAIDDDTIHDAVSIGDGQILVDMIDGGITFAFPLKSFSNSDSDGNPFEIQAAAGRDSGVTPRNGGDIKLTTGAAVNGGTAGNLVINGTPGVTAGPFTVITGIRVVKGIVTVLTGS